MNDFIERLQREYVELDKRTNKLTDFVYSYNFINLPDLKQRYARTQLDMMRAYREILDMRIRLEIGN